MGNDRFGIPELSGRATYFILRAPGSNSGCGLTQIRPHLFGMPAKVLQQIMALLFASGLAVQIPIDIRKRVRPRGGNPLEDRGPSFLHGRQLEPQLKRQFLVGKSFQGRAKKFLIFLMQRQ